MPLIQVTSTERSLNKKDQDSLMSRLSNAVLTAERAPVTDAGAQSLVWAYYDERPQDAIYIGGKNLDEPPLRIAVTTPEGALNAATKKSLVEEIARIVDELLGVYEGRLNHWVMLYDHAEGNWAGGGQIFPLVGIQAAMNITPEQ
jgi:phenylpyruvate tautomerase PptA (4-oxalocrotonate tautomerase family)